MKFVRVAQNLVRCDPYGTYYYRGHSRGGKVVISLKTKDRGIAERRLREKLDDFKAWKSDRNRVTFSSLARRWRESILDSTDLKPSSRKYRIQNLAVLERYFGRMAVRDITETDCARWKARRMRERASPQRFNNELGCLRMVFDFSKKEGVTFDNPAESVDRMAIPEPEPNPPTDDELRAIVDHLCSHQSKTGYAVVNQEAAWFVELLAYSGMRQWEAAALTWAEVDWQRNQLTVSGGARGTKNNRSRIVPLFGPLRELLLRMKNAGLSGKRVSTVQSCYRALAAACKELNIGPYTHHNFRDYFVTRALERGVSFPALAGWIGHQDNGILLSKTYAKLRSSHSHAEAEKMGAWESTVVKSVSGESEKAATG